MRKIFFYHQWQYEKAEKFLSDMESHGYRLKRARFSFLFEFKKAPPKKVRYIFLYSFVKDSNYNHYEASKYVLGCCGGSQVCGKSIFESEVYRITQTDADLNPVIQFRNAYLKRAFVLKMFMSLIFMMPAIPLGFIDCVHCYDWRAYVLFFIAILSFVSFLYYLFGLLSLRRKNGPICLN